VGFSTRCCVTAFALYESSAIISKRPRPAIMYRVSSAEISNLGFQPTIVTHQQVEHLQPLNLRFHDVLGIAYSIPLLGFCAHSPCLQHPSMRPRHQAPSTRRKDQSERQQVRILWSRPVIEDTRQCDGLTVFSLKVTTHRSNSSHENCNR